MNNKLTTLQQDFLNAFFQRDNRFFLTGGAALAGFYLGHRETHDLDLFTALDALEEGVAVTQQIARQFGATLEPIQTAPDVRRFLMRRGADGIVIDLLRDRAPQLTCAKPVINGITIDTAHEILANKLCTLLERSEIRDLVDVRALELAGYSVENAIEAAALKDAGFTPAQLGWVLSQIQFSDSFVPPGDVPADVLREYLAKLIERLAKLAFPRNDPN